MMMLVFIQVLNTNLLFISKSIIFIQFIRAGCMEIMMMMIFISGSIIYSDYRRVSLLYLHLNLFDVLTIFVLLPL